MKLAFAAGALTLMTIAGISSTPADAQRWRGGYAAHAGYGHHYRAPHLGARGHDYGLRRHGYGYARGYGGYARRGYAGGYGYARRGYGGGYGPGDDHTGYSHSGYSHGGAYTAGFNRGAEAQWLVNMQHWRQLYGPSGIFAGFGGGVGGYGFGGGYGLGHRFGAGYGGGHGNGCHC